MRRCRLAGWRIPHIRLEPVKSSVQIERPPLVLLIRTGTPTAAKTAEPHIRSASMPGHRSVISRPSTAWAAIITGDAANAVLAAAGYNFHLLLKWLELLLSTLLPAQEAAAGLPMRLKLENFTDDLLRCKELEPLPRAATGVSHFPVEV